MITYPPCYFFFHVGLYYDANLKSGNDGSVTISAVSDSQEYCTPANCSELFWKREFGVTIGDEVYYTLESYNVSKVWTKIFHHIQICWKFYYSFA